MEIVWRACNLRLICTSVFMLRRYVLEERSDEEVWTDVRSVCANGMPCFVGTKGAGSQKLYDNLVKEHSLHL